jgi:sodium-coupled neutral amino acid transporter 11
MPADVDESAESGGSTDDDDDDESTSCGSETDVGEPEEGIPGTSPAQTVFNIVKNIVGEGMLSLAAGVAAGTGLIIAIVLMLFFCLLLGYTFSGVGRVCKSTGTSSFKDAAAQVVGPRLGLFMAIVLACKTMMTCIAYAIVIGDSYSHILKFFGFDGFFTYHATVLCIITGFVLVPLCLQRDLSILSYTSLFGILCEVCVVCIVTRRFSDGSYQPGGKFYEEIPEEKRPDFGSDNTPDMFGMSITTVVLLCNLSTAFIAHYNAPKFYSQMRKRSPKRFSGVVSVGFLISLVIYIWIASAGYLTFGLNCQGNLLDNYAVNDPAATIARVAIGFAVIFGYPLAFTALRDSTMSLLNVSSEQKRWFFPISFALLIFITLIGSTLENLGLVNSLGGAIFGMLITLVFPAVLMLTVLNQAKDDGGSWMTRMMTFNGEKGWSRSERPTIIFCIVLGTVMLFVGSTVVLLKNFAPDVLKND